jgi:hypothetical protein
MKTLTLLLTLSLTLPAPLLAQQGRPTILAQARAETSRLAASDGQRRQPLVVIESRMEHPILFWTGAGLLAIGVISMLGSVSWARDSDLSNEFQSVRLGTDLAPCGTSIDETRLPVAECKLNAEMFWLGTGLTIVGGGMMVFGGKQIETVVPRPLVSASVRF